MDYFINNNWIYYNNLIYYNIIMNNYSKDDYLVTYENIYGYKNYNKVIILLFTLLLIIYLIIVIFKFN
jgi:hypothetical protein